MARVDVACEPRPGRLDLPVDVTEGASATSHRVTVATTDLERLIPAPTDPTDLVRRSFAFLLEREPKESILARVRPDGHRPVLPGLGGRWIGG